MIDVERYLRIALLDRKLRAQAKMHFISLLVEGDLLDHQDHGHAIRPSDFGSCGLSLHATVHDLETLPREPIDEQLTRLDSGSLLGAWQACLLKAAAESDGWDIRLEYEPKGGGHIDALCCSLRLPFERIAVEFKTIYEGGTPIKRPTIKDNENHLLQSADYADRTASTMALCYLKLSAKKGERFGQFDFEPAPFVPYVVAERARLAPALGDEKPAADPQAFYSCYTCRYGACEKNLNKMASSVFLEPPQLQESDF